MLAPPLGAVRRQPRLTAGLAAFGSRSALVDAAGTLTYAQLAADVGRTATALGPVRRLVLLAGANERDALVAYLGALAGGHVVLLVPGEDAARVDGWIQRWDPDVVVRRGPQGWTLRERRAGSAHDLHPDLALLLTTSGSTGSPKLVRLSYDGVDANAQAIAAYLQLDATDRAVTTLPLSYCYGLSVVHAHLLRGAAVLLTSASVVDRCFWELCREHGVTSLAGVPHTFDLLERSRGAHLPLPTLRRVTQAGGALPPEQVRRWALAGRRAGWDLFVMYGQTEATARMAYLPPERAADRPGAVGVAVPGGSLRVDRPGPDGVGELVYRGPNVMLGYAEQPADLARGRELDELRTGDLGRRAQDGLFEVVGRSSRTAKLFGLRLDLAVVEQALARDGTAAWCTEADGALVVLAERPSARLAARAASAAGLPQGCVRVVAVDALPRTSRGKVDGAAALALATAAPPATPPAATSVHALYAQVLGVDRVRDDDTFAGLGGDSLCYVEVALRLEDLLGELPAHWHTTPVGALVPGARRPRLDTTVLLRALGILLVVASHAHLSSVLGGAHALLAVAGWSFARLRLTDVPLRARTAGTVRALRRVVVPTVAVLAVAAPLTPQVGAAQVLLLNSVLGPDVLGPAWRYWFVEALVQILVALAVLLAVPAVDRLERRYPLGLAAAVLALALLPRFGAVDLGPGPDSTQSAAAVLWVFALGWCAARASGLGQRAAVSGLAVLLLLPGSLPGSTREAVVLAAVLLLLWVPAVPLPQVLAPLRAALGAIAGASLWTYLVHWQVLDLVPHSPTLRFVGSLAVGLAAHRLACRVGRQLRMPRTAPERPVRRAPDRRRVLLEAGAA